MENNTNSVLSSILKVLSLRNVLTVLLSVIATAIIIYGTPLRYTDLIEPKINDIDPVSFYANFKANPDHYLFIDVRQPDAFAAYHAVGSKNHPLHTMYDLRHSLPKKDQEIVLICSGGRASGVAFGYLQHYGFTNIARIQGGIENWMEQGLPIEGTKKEQMEKQYGKKTASSTAMIDVSKYICV
jgi:rhodanese-related sulfurtransferase